MVEDPPNTVPEAPEPPRSSRRKDPSELSLPGAFGGSVKVLGVLLVLMVVALVFGRKVWNVRTRAKTDSLLSEARQAIDRKDWAVAAKHIRQARELTPEDMGLLRLMVDYLDQTGQEPVFVVQALGRLKQAGLQQPGDVWIAGRASLKKGDIAAARALWESLPAESRDKPEALEFKAGILRQEGGAGEAQKLQQLAAQRAADDPDAILTAAVMDAESAYPVQHMAGIERLWAMTTRADTAGLAALRFLTTQGALTLSEARQIHQRIGAHAEAGLADELRALTAVMRLAPAERVGLLDSLLDRHRNLQQEDMLLLARWLAEERESERLAKLVPWSTMIKSSELFPIGIQSLAESGRWQEMNELLKQRSLPMSEEGLAVWRALVASRLQPDLDEAQKHLQVAIKRAAAVGSLGPLRAATKVAEDLELYEVAMEGYHLLAQPKMGNEFEMLEKCWETATRLRDSTQLLETARRQNALRPTSVLYAQRLDYLRLLCGEEMESVRPPAPDTVAHELRNLEMPAILTALKAYRLGDRPLAVKALAELRSVAKLTAGQRAVYAGLLALLGDPASAFQQAEKVSPLLLTAEERGFLGKAL